MDDPDYLAWLKINHPTEVSSTTTKSSSSLVSGEHSKSSSASGKSKVSSSDALSEILVIPSPISRPKTNRKPALNAETVVITNDSVLEDLKRKEVEKDEGKKEKEAKKLAKEHRKKVREEKRLAKEQKKKERAEKTAKRQRGKQTRSKKVTQTEKRTPTCDALADLQLSSSCDEDDSSQESETEDEDNTTCPKCGVRYGDSTEKWFACEGCNQWFNQKCTNIKRREPEYYYCEKCTL